MKTKKRLAIPSSSCSRTILIWSMKTFFKCCAMPRGGPDLHCLHTPLHPVCVSDPISPFPREVLTWFYVLSSIFASVERERGGNDEIWIEGAISVACSRNGLRQMVMQSEMQMEAIFHDDLRRRNWHERVRGVSPPRNRQCQARRIPQRNVCRLCRNAFPNLRRKSRS